MLLTTCHLHRVQLLKGALCGQQDNHQLTTESVLHGVERVLHAVPNAAIHALKAFVHMFVSHVGENGNSDEEWEEGIVVDESWVVGTSLRRISV